ncbi:C13 family peptidase [Pseudoxanthobacter sp.]|uniref:C13 family peptidase n=1 Tax=Pseudoxanthobacter sp. TaxID=1925742 RepID=UPI002FE1F642
MLHRTPLRRRRTPAGPAALAGLLVCVAAAALFWLAGPPAAGAATAAPVAWKALLIAGDDSEPVFANGVDEMRRRLMSFGVKAPDITVLKAGVRSPAVRATSDNIDRSFDRLDAPGGTGCFVFITSHGQPHGGLIMSDEEAYLPPDYLARRLDETCGTRPTVVIASGCYSGQFTADRRLATPHRIVLAAARADRPSFGCGVDFRYTFYDACLLGALRQGSPWQAIARSVDACVTRRERQEGFEASRPQAVFGRSVGSLTAF